MDLGIARGIEGESITRASSILGTAGYVSPEQARGEPVDHRSDIYSLGCVLYEMLTGRQPFEADNPVAVAYQHVHEAPVPPSSLEPSVPPALESVVLRAMEKDPAGEVPECGRHGDGSRGTGPLRSPVLGATQPMATLPTTPAPVVAAGDVLHRRAHETSRSTPAATPDGPAADRRGRARPPRRPRVRAVQEATRRRRRNTAARSPSASVSPSRSSPSSSPSPSPTPSQPPADPVRDAVVALQTLVTEGLNDGTISDARRRRDREEARGRAREVRGRRHGEGDRRARASPRRRRRAGRPRRDPRTRRQQRLDTAIEDIEEQMFLASPPEDD